MNLIHRIIQHLSVKTSDLFLELNSTEVQDEQFDEYFFNKRDLGKVLRELIRLLSVQRRKIIKTRQRNLRVKIPMKIYTPERYAEVFKRTIAQAGRIPVVVDRVPATGAAGV